MLSISYGHREKPQTCVDTVCRVKCSIMDASAMAHHDVVMPRHEMQVRNLASHPLAVWDDTDANWYKCIPCRGVEGQKKSASVALTFARGYLAALVSAVDDPAFDPRGDPNRAPPAEILSDMKKSCNSAGEVPMGAVVESFRKCPGRVFGHTLTLLTWAGHIGSFNTLALYKYILTVLVDAYWEGQWELFRSEASVAKVRSCFPCASIW